MIEAKFCWQIGSWCEKACEGAYCCYRVFECPVCMKTALLVLHHDHFSDLCQRIIETMDIERRSELFKTRAAMTTFDPVLICHNCNMIDVEIKKEHSYLPRWVSFSTDEMKEIRQGASIAELWKRKKDAYRPTLRLFLAFGVSQEQIRTLWLSRNPSMTGRNVRRQQMLEKWYKLPFEVRSLFKSLGNEKQLAFHMRDAGWTWQDASSFIYWYHAANGDPYLRKTSVAGLYNFGRYGHKCLGQFRFRDWFCSLVERGHPYVHMGLQKFSCQL